MQHGQAFTDGTSISLPQPQGDQATSPVRTSGFLQLPEQSGPPVAGIHIERAHVASDGYISVNPSSLRLVDDQYSYEGHSPLLGRRGVAPEEVSSIVPTPPEFRASSGVADRLREHYFLCQIGMGPDPIDPTPSGSADRAHSTSPQRQPALLVERRASVANPLSSLELGDAFNGIARHFEQTQRRDVPYHRIIDVSTDMEDVPPRSPNDMPDVFAEAARCEQFAEDDMIEAALEEYRAGIGRPLTPIPTLEEALGRDPGLERSGSIAAISPKTSSGPVPPVTEPSSSGWSHGHSRTDSAWMTSPGPHEPKASSSKIASITENASAAEDAQNQSPEEASAMPKTKGKGKTVQIAEPAPPNRDTPEHRQVLADINRVMKQERFRTELAKYENLSAEASMVLDDEDDPELALEIEKAMHDAKVATQKKTRKDRVGPSTTKPIEAIILPEQDRKEAGRLARKRVARRRESQARDARRQEERRAREDVKVEKARRKADERRVKDELKRSRRVASLGEPAAGLGLSGGAADGDGTIEEAAQVTSEREPKTTPLERVRYAAENVGGAMGVHRIRPGARRVWSKIRRKPRATEMQRDDSSGETLSEGGARTTTTTTTSPRSSRPGGRHRRSFPWGSSSRGGGGPNPTDPATDESEREVIRHRRLQHHSFSSNNAETATPETPAEGGGGAGGARKRFRSSASQAAGRVRHATLDRARRASLELRHRLLRSTRARLGGDDQGRGDSGAVPRIVVQRPASCGYRPVGYGRV